MLWVKKAQITFDGVKLLSDNDYYDPVILEQGEANGLIVIGRVVRSYKDF
ncbi:hypothetical protein [Phocoenobacter skyensis]|nr:hypothetical protein [Pasteurella skyensis]